MNGTNSFGQGNPYYDPNDLETTLCNVSSTLYVIAKMVRSTDGEGVTLEYNESAGLVSICEGLNGALLMAMSDLETKARKESEHD